MYFSSTHEPFFDPLDGFGNAEAVLRRLGVADPQLEADRRVVLERLRSHSPGELKQRVERQQRMPGEPVREALRAHRIGVGEVGERLPAEHFAAKHLALGHVVHRRSLARTA
ncbi:MAG TPA: hypothetical protein VF418_01765 [Sphingomonadaceae bacterium]